jgi:CheY-like chemotaxis protein
LVIASCLGRHKGALTLSLYKFQNTLLDGYQTLLRLKSQQTSQQIPVVMMSAHASAQEIQACYRAGAQSFLLKQTNLDAMKADIAALLV